MVKKVSDLPNTASATSEFYEKKNRRQNNCARNLESVYIMPDHSSQNPYCFSFQRNVFHYIMINIFS